MRPFGAPNDDETSAMRRKARELSLRLLVILEQQDRPLAARHFAEQRARTSTRA